MPWGTLKDQWERRTALKIAVRQTLSQQMSVGRSRTVDWFANMFANLSTAHDHWFSTARPLRLRPTPWGTRKVILRSPRFSAVNCPHGGRMPDVTRALYLKAFEILIFDRKKESCKLSQQLISKTWEYLCQPCQSTLCANVTNLDTEENHFEMVHTV